MRTRRRDDSTFANAVAVVTGGASGIGRALATELVARGSRVTIADIDGDAATRAALEIARGGGGGSVVGARLDVCDAAAVHALVHRVVDREGRLDFLFNNAGISLGGESHTMDGSHWRRVIDTNLVGVINGVVAAYPLMVEQGHGHIVNTASGTGLAPAVMTVAYTASKHGVVGLSTALRPEAARYGVRVSVLCPGAVETAILDRPPPDDLPATPRATLTPREYLGVVGLTPMPANAFATRALRSIARNRSIIAIPASTKALWYGYRVSPALIDRLGRITTERVLRKLRKKAAETVG